MKLSIITINYNDAVGLRKTIDSVLGQTYQEFQYIVIDGNSTDGSKEVLEQYNSKIDVVVSEPDSGIYNAMNKGASYAIGEYLMFLNSGDSLYDSGVVYKLFHDYQFSEDIVSSAVCNYSDTDNDAYLKFPPEKISLYTFFCGSLPHPSSLIKRELFERIGGYIEEYKIISDWCFFVDALLIHNCTYRTTPLVMVRFNRNGISSVSGHTEFGASRRFLRNRFGRIVDDYLPASDEALSNFMYWVATQKGFRKKILMLPFKVCNRFFNLRNRLKRRMGIRRIDA